MTTQLSPHFSLGEFEASDTAVRLGIDNHIPDSTVMDAVQQAALMLERIREFLSERAGRDIPIQVVSGYRCVLLNKAVGGTAFSDHILGAAADWKAPDFGVPTDICRVLAPAVTLLGIGQLINEFPSASGLTGWVHTSTRPPLASVNRIITINQHGTFAGIEGALV